LPDLLNVVLFSKHLRVRYGQGFVVDPFHDVYVDEVSVFGDEAGVDLLTKVFDAHDACNDILQRFLEQIANKKTKNKCQNGNNATTC